MIKGINKQIVIVKNTGSDFFEEAIFIIKPSEKRDKLSDGDLASEARKIIDKYSNIYPPHITQNISTPKKKWTPALPFWELVLYGVSGLAVLLLIALLLYVVICM